MLLENLNSAQGILTVRMHNDFDGINYKFPFWCSPYTLWQEVDTCSPKWGVYQVQCVSINFDVVKNTANFHIKGYK